MFKLVGADEERFYSWLLKPGSYIVGRRTGCDFCIPHMSVSRQHAEIVVKENGNETTVSDLGSHNGTYVNEKPVTQKIILNTGDRIRFGSTEFRIMDSDGSTGEMKGLSKTVLASEDLQKSVFLSIDDALKPLPDKSTELPNLVSTFFDMAKLLNLTEPREEMLEKSLKMVSKVIPYDRLAILFVDEESHEVFTAATLSREGREYGEFRLSRTIISDIITNKRAMVIGDPAEDPRFAEQKSIIMSNLKSAVAAPMFDEGRVLGILYADTTNPQFSYSQEHLRLMATFGNIIASRLLNYELLSERHEKGIIEAELKRASEIQKTLLVTGFPEIERYDIYAYQEQSRQVGGDLYDVKILPDGRVLFMLADVSGKGMGAALLMSNILASFRILYEQEKFDLGKAVESVSLQLCRFSSPGDFATLFAGLLDPKTNELLYINAGHNPPLVANKDGILSELKTSGPMIGAFDFVTWEEHRQILEPGDLIYIFTDGITEADNGVEQFGEKRMREFFLENRNKELLELAELFMDRINEFMAEAPRSDDITMMILRRKTE